MILSVTMHNDPALNVYGYTRVSSREQAQEGLSLNAQADQIESYCKARGWNLVRTFSDVASGADEKRPGLQHMLAVIREVQAVVVVRADRLGRLRYWDNIDRRLEKHHVFLVSIAEGFDVTTPAGRAMRGMLRVFASLERELVGERTREVLRHKMHAGEHYGPVPYGYRVAGTQLVPVEAELVWVKQMRRRKQEKGWSYEKIAAWLNRKGAPTKKGGQRWYASTVHSVLRGPIRKMRRAKPMPDK